MLGAKKITDRPKTTSRDGLQLSAQEIKARTRPVASHWTFFLSSSLGVGCLPVHDEVWCLNSVSLPFLRRPIDSINGVARVSYYESNYYHPLLPAVAASLCFSHNFILSVLCLLSRFFLLPFPTEISSTGLSYCWDIVFFSTSFCTSLKGFPFIICSLHLMGKHYSSFYFTLLSLLFTHFLLLRLIFSDNFLLK